MSSHTDHIVYTDAKAKEMQRLLEGRQTMIIRGAAGRKLPHGRVFEGDTLYFVNNNGEGTIKARGTVTSVFNSEKMSDAESTELIKNNQDKLQLDKRQMERWCGKRYIVLVGVGNVTPVEPLAFDRSSYGNMDDWLIVGDINKVKV